MDREAWQATVLESDTQGQSLCSFSSDSLPVQSLGNFRGHKICEEQ